MERYRAGFGAGVLFVAQWALGGCNFLIGLDDVSVGQEDAGAGTGATTTSSNGGSGAGGSGGGGAPTTSSGGGEGGTSTSSGEGGTGGTSTSSGEGGGVTVTSPGSGEGGGTSTTSGDEGGGASTTSGSVLPDVLCGNAVWDEGEQCDDGNADGGDGCSASCLVEPLYQCAPGPPSVCTEQETLCGDAVDNDGDGLVDGEDTDCALPSYAPDPPCAVSRVHRSVEAPMAIPDGAGEAWSALAVPDGFDVAHTTVLVDVAHTRAADLHIKLFPPSGPPRVLTQGNGGNGANYHATVFDTTCPTSVSFGQAPFEGCYKPQAALPAGGEQASGQWALQVVDTKPAHTGTFGGWTLVLCAQ